MPLRNSRNCKLLSNPLVQSLNILLLKKFANLNKDLIIEGSYLSSHYAIQVSVLCIEFLIRMYITSEQSFRE